MTMTRATKRKGKEPASGTALTPKGPAPADRRRRNGHNGHSWEEERAHEEVRGRAWHRGSLCAVNLRAPTLAGLRIIH